MEFENEIKTVTIENEDGTTTLARMIPSGKGYRILHRNSVDAFEEKKKRDEEYAQKKKTVHFAQFFSIFGESVLGHKDFNAKMLECIMLSIPYIQYSNPNEKEEEKNVMKENGAPLLAKNFKTIWGVTINTAKKYLALFVKHKVFEELKTDGKVTTGYRFNVDMVLKGIKAGEERTKKVVLEKLNEVIKIAKKEVAKEIRLEEKRKIKKYDSASIYPLALLLGLIAHTHYKSFIPVKNHEDNKKPFLVKDDETVTNVLSSEHKRRRFKFFKQHELWNLYSGQNIRKLQAKKINELNKCIEILQKANAIGIFNSGKDIMLLNPKLVFVSPDLKCDEEWKKIIQTLFNIAKEDSI